MTTIAYRDGVVAADTLSTCNGLRDDYGPKVWRKGRVIMAACGSRATCLQFRIWVSSGMEGPHPFEKDPDGNGLVVSPAGVVCWSEHGPWPVRSPFYALGTGYQVALGAMEHGATAEEAIRAAIRWDTRTGGDVTAYRLEAK